MLGYSQHVAVVADPAEFGSEASLGMSMSMSTMDVDYRQMDLVCMVASMHSSIHVYPYVNACMHNPCMHTCTHAYGPT